MGSGVICCDTNVFSRQHSKTRPLFLIADILMVWLAFEAAYMTRTHLQLERVFYLAPATKALLTGAAILSWTLAGLWIGVYGTVLQGRRTVLLLRVLQQSFGASVLMVLVQYIQRNDISLPFQLSRPFLGLLFAYAVALLSAFRLAARPAGRLILGGDAARRYIYIAGTGPGAVRVGRLIERSEGFGLSLLGFLDEQPGRIQLAREYEVKELGRLQELLRSQVVDEVVFVVDSQRLAGLEDVLLLCEEEGVRTRLHLGFFPHVQSRVHLERLEGEAMLTFAGAPHDDIRLMVKRGQDLFLSLGALLVLLPLLLLIAGLIRITSPGPVIFRQRRCGLNGRRFTLYKFRTMVVDAESRRAELEHLNVKTTAFKIPNDPRQTGVGRWLRKFSLDELPQLWNIVRGEMAIVGPRPPVPEEVERYELWQRRRLRMRPGLTCLWTLAGRDKLAFDEWMELDLEYIDRWSLGLDWEIILQTIPHVVSGRGAN
jgi:exopolysaccharide biosynthesis polyprenyl glycosylphosphotransferase